jgi:hypothetical protein
MDATRSKMKKIKTYAIEKKICLQFATGAAIVLVATIITMLILFRGIIVKITKRNGWGADLHFVLEIRSLDSKIVSLSSPKCLFPECILPLEMF